jgi:peptide-methionine (S)-S-oxide reductase
MIRDVDASAHWPGKTVTTVSRAVTFWEMRPEDQDYLQRFLDGCMPPFPRQHDEPEIVVAPTEPSSAG